MKVVKDPELKIERKESLNKMLWNTVQSHPRVSAIGYWDDGKLKYLTYEEFWERVRKLSKFLISSGLRKGDRVAIYADTRYEWEIADFAVLTAGGVVVTVHSVLNREQVEYILRDSESRVVFTEKKYAENVPEDFEVYFLEELEKLVGEVSDDEFESRWKSVEPDDLASIVYTSGTTGEPKGAMLTHWNWRFNCHSVMSITPFYPGEPHICYLPLSHVYQRLVFFAGISRAATAVFCSPQQFLETSTAVKPVGLIVVPRILERVNAGIVEKVEKSPALAKKIFYWSREVAIECGKRMSRGEKYGFWLNLKRIIADRLVFSKIRENLGLTRIRFVCSSAAELQKELAYMFNGMGIPVIEGYGMTETAAPSNLNPVGRFKPGTVGLPIPGIEEAIAEDGEILVRGDNVMKGYWRKEAETRKTFTEDGWLKTGDLGEFDEDGYLIFLGRKKHIIVLDTGKNVSPVPIEEELLKNPFVSDAVIIGDGKPYVTALIVPNFGMLVEFADKNGIEYDRNKTIVQRSISGEEEIVAVDEKLVENNAVKELYAKIVDDVNSRLAKHETIKKFKLLPEAFSLEKGEITPTLKKRRHVILKRYEKFIEEMYKR
ncbi:MAG: Long-chain-fatty-acid--CoA ligase (FadD-2) [Archaeoglobus fulgidus]|uniref:Long-chain-fatty-acid--CoA ligase (FadD-2) n=1 Tax=Archaeoglobus fulgidus TaxID=2234 RepID=A0A124FBE8_ARCFL|nr:long-chain fatty acid--CoA ligase [Archaeoglobus fulgidus]KUJ92669.1 MAG: Long-chain-fatty-acid--CoA ligase (FadD-2) [Archaeoglobus fulgidus]KUK05289.1 MAG: Long-chain-fatty-acid--CoA ligase (FadD-2) [Archaeoglobus fulgidus]